MLRALQIEYVEGLLEEGTTLKEVAQNFKIPPIRITLPKKQKSDSEKTPQFITEIHRSIEEFPRDSWEFHFDSSGNQSYENITLLEETFKENSLPEHNWDFYYTRIKDESGKVVVACYYTLALLKDDMLAPAEISKKVEVQRAESPYFLTSKVIMTGNPFTKGKSVCINYEHPNWKAGLAQLVKHLQEQCEELQAARILIREFNTKDKGKLKDQMLELGLVEQKLLNNSEVALHDWNSHEEFQSKMKSRYRYSFKKEILPFTEFYDVSTERPSTQEEIEQCHELFNNVHRRAGELSMFGLPFSLFQKMCYHPQYDIIRLYPKGKKETPAAVMFSHVNQRLYNALLVGLDYDYVYEHNAYKQILYQTVLRAKELNCEKLDLAFTAEIEKKKVGATVHPLFAYVLEVDHLNFAVLDNLD